MAGNSALAARRETRWTGKTRRLAATIRDSAAARPKGWQSNPPTDPKIAYRSVWNFACSETLGSSKTVVGRESVSAPFPIHRFWAQRRVVSRSWVRVRPKGMARPVAPIGRTAQELTTEDIAALSSGELVLITRRLGGWASIPQNLRVPLVLALGCALPALARPCAYSGRSSRRQGPPSDPAPKAGLPP